MTDKKQDLITVLAAVTSLHILIESVEKGISIYRETGDPEFLKLACVTIIAKSSINNAPGGLSEVIEDLNLLEKGLHLLKPNKS